VRYGGLFAPAHGLRKAIVARAPGPPRAEGGCRARGGGDAQEVNAGKEANAERTTSPSPKDADAGLAAALLAVVSEVAETATTAGTKRGELLGAATPKPWLDGATLLRRTFDLDVLSCPCGGRIRFIALVTEREAIAAPAGESRTPDDAASESPRAVTDAVRYGPPAGLRVARGLSCGRGDVTSGFARRCAEVRALRGEKRGLGGPRFVCRSWSGPATRGWVGRGGRVAFRFLGRAHEDCQISGFFCENQDALMGATLGGLLHAACFFCRMNWCVWRMSCWSSSW
jgi:hypothetical protein